MSNDIIRKLEEKLEQVQRTHKLHHALFPASVPAETPEIQNLKRRLGRAIKWALINERRRLQRNLANIDKTLK